MIPIWDKQKLNRGRVFEYLSGNNDLKKNGAIPANIDDLLVIKEKKKNLCRIEAKYMGRCVNRTKKLRKKMVVYIAEIKNELYADLSTFRAKKKVRKQMVELLSKNEKLIQMDEKLKHKVTQAREICETGIALYLKGFSPSVSATISLDEPDFGIYEDNLKNINEAVNEVETFVYTMDQIVERGTAHEKE